MATRKTPRQNVYINDLISLSDGDFKFGDPGLSDPNALIKTDVGGDDQFTTADYTRETGDNVLIEALGETVELRDSARGGQDTFWGGDYAGFRASGRINARKFQVEPFDGFLDPLIGELDRGSGNEFAGDGLTIRNSSRGGNDVATGGINAKNFFWGDARDFALDKANGGNDTLNGGDAVSQAGLDLGYDTDPNDYPSRNLTGDVASLNYLVGDADTFGIWDGGSGSSSVLGGSDKLNGGDALAGYFSAEVWNFMAGDAAAFDQDERTNPIGIYGSGTGGDDFIVGGDAIGGSFLYQDGNGVGNGIYYDAYYEGDASALNFLMGDALEMHDSSSGGNDNIVGGSAISKTSAPEGTFNRTGDQGPDREPGRLEADVYNFMAGDGYFLDDSTQCGSDTLRGGNAQGLATADSSSNNQTRAMNVMAGDGYEMGLFNASPVKFGNDQLTGGDLTNASGNQLAQVRNWIWGDLGVTPQVGDPIFYPNGNNTIDDPETGFWNITEWALDDNGIPPGLMEGDRNSGTGGVNGGSDTLTGGKGRDVYNYLVGDADILKNAATGGGDTLIGGDFVDTDNVLIGDARELDGSRGGNDRLISGAGVDLMWGDAQTLTNGAIGGADIFTFRTNCNDDAIFDFNRSEGDKIDLSAFNTGRKNMTAFKNFETFIASGRVVDTAGFSYDTNIVSSIVDETFSGGPGILIDLSVSANSRGSVYIEGLSVGDLTSSMFQF